MRWIANHCCIALLLLAAAQVHAAEPRCVAIFGNSDLHGAIEAHELTVGDTKLRYGGLLAQGAYIERLRRHYGDRMLLIDGGDIFQGTLVSNLSRGRAIVAAYNMLGFNAAAIGNHEFDYGATKGNEADLLSVLKRRIKEAQFPFLAVNVYEAATHKPIAWPNAPASVIVEIGGVRVGLIGASTPETPQVTKPLNVASLEFPNPASLIIAEARQLRARGAELVVLTAHIGSKCKDLADPRDASSCRTDAGLIPLLRSMPPSTVDVALGGHTHSFIAHWINDTATIQAGSRGRQLAWVDACVAESGGLDRNTTKIHQPIDMCLDTWADGGCRTRKDPASVQPAKYLGAAVNVPAALSQLMQPYFDEVAALYARPIGVRLSTPLVRETRSNSLGDLVAESMRRLTNADFGVQNRGGVRADLPAGDLIYGQLYEVLPFDNQVAKVGFTGEQTKRLIAFLMRRRDGESPFLAGLTIKRRGDDFDLLTSNGALVRPAAKYWLATSDFLALGGEGLGELFGEVPPDEHIITDTDMRQALIALLKQKYPLPQ